MFTASTSNQMKTQFFAGLFAAATTLTVAISHTAPATAYDIKGRDQAPANFNIQEFKDFVGKEARYLSPETIGAHRLDITKIKMNFDHDVKVYFIGETAGGYRNQLNFTATNGAEVTGGKIFGDTSCKPGQDMANFGEFCANPNNPLANKAKEDQPLNVGDFAELGKFKAGTEFDFQLVSNGINGGIWNNGVQGIFGLNDATNPDKLQHVMAYYYKDFLVLGYEDLWGGGDKDYNDTVFAIDFGKNNAREVAGISVPEPSATVALIGAAAVGIFASRRSRPKQVD